jgi:hypothetical protein
LRLRVLLHLMHLLTNFEQLVAGHEGF